MKSNQSKMIFMRKEERESYIKALLYIAMSDHTLDENEVNHLIKVGKQNGLSQEAAEDLMYESLYSKETLRDILSNIKKKDTKEDLIRDLLTICYADGHYSKTEWEGISIISSMLEIEGKTLGKIHEDIKVKERKRNKKERIGKAVSKLKGDLEDAVEAGKGGAYNVGIFVLENGEDAIHAIARGLGKLGANISVTLASVKAIKAQNIELRKKLSELEMNEATKQRIIIKLNGEIESLKRELKDAEKTAEEHAELIKELQETISEFLATKDMVEMKEVS